MSKFRGIELSFSLDILWRCKQELEKAKYPLFLEELIVIIKKVALLHNHVREKNGEGLIKRQIKVEPNLGKWTTNLPNLVYLNELLKSVMMELATQRAGKKFNKIVDEIIVRIQKLYDDYDQAILFINRFEQSVKGLNSDEFTDFIAAIDLKYWDVFMGIRDSELIKSPTLKDPLNKYLPQGKLAAYRNAVQKITTYETGSKAPLMEKGRGLSADPDKKLQK